jgi:hypothetical protein
MTGVDLAKEGTEMESRDERGGPLSELLASWQAPQPSAALDLRVLEAYRNGPGRVPLLRRLLTMSIPVPLPLAVAALLLLLVTGLVALRRPGAPTAPPQLAEEAAPTQTARRLGAPVVTRTSLAGFRPVSEVNVTVVQGGEGR